MNKIKLVASDMDGTLLNSQKDISKANIEAINQLHANNIIFAIASGRNFHELNKYCQQFSFPFPVITLNGGQIFNDKKEIIYDQPLQRDIVEQLVDLLTDLGVYFELLNESIFYSNSKEKRLALVEDILKQANMTTSKAMEDDRFKMTQFGDYSRDMLSRHTFYKIRAFDLGGFDLQEVGKKIVDHKIPCEISSSASSNIEINPYGVNKGKAIQVLCEHYQIQLAQVLAFGDNLNDLSMIDVAGHFCAMGNSHQEIIKLSDSVTDACDRDGVAKAINKLVFS